MATGTTYNPLVNFIAPLFRVSSDNAAHRYSVYDNAGTKYIKGEYYNGTTWVTQFDWSLIDAAYDTIGELVSAINSITNWYCVSLHSSHNSLASTVLDYVSNWQAINGYWVYLPASLGSYPGRIKPRNQSNVSLNYTNTTFQAVTSPVGYNGDYVVKFSPTNAGDYFIITIPTCDVVEITGAYVVGNGRYDVKKGDSSMTYLPDVYTNAKTVDDERYDEYFVSRGVSNQDVIFVARSETPTSPLHLDYYRTGTGKPPYTIVSIQ